MPLTQNRLAVLLLTAGKGFWRRLLSGTTIKNDCEIMPHKEGSTFLREALESRTSYIDIYNKYHPAASDIDSVKKAASLVGFKVPLSHEEHIEKGENVKGTRTC